MAASKIKINTKSLKKDTEDISNALKTIQTKIESLQSDVTALNQMWTGDANKEFNKAFQDDITDLEQICKSIQKLINYEKKAKSEYNSCEQKVSDLIDDIHI